MTPLQRRILDLLPGLDYGLDVFLRLFDVEETEDIPTAAIPTTGSPRLRINPRFVAEQCPDDEDLVTLLLHELHHVLLGHDRLGRSISRAENIAFDAVINAMICRRRPEPRQTALLRRINRADAFPGCLLRPPEGPRWKPARVRVGPPGTATVLADLYGTGAATVEAVLALLLRAPDAPLPEATVLLGSHEPGDGDMARPEASAPFVAARAVAAAWPPARDAWVDRTMGAALAELGVPTRRTPTPVAVLRTALLAAARPGDVRAPGRGVGPMGADLAWPTADRRAFALAAGGGTPLLWRGELLGTAGSREVAPVDVYVDVSPSCLGAVPALFAAVRSCRAWVAPAVFQMSTEVHPATLAELAAGRVRSTGGTLGAACTAHLASRRSRAAVLLTDGLVGPIPKEHHAACRAARLQVVLTPGGRADDLSPVAAAVHVLPSLEWSHP